MKQKTFLPIVAALIIVLAGACQKDKDVANLTDSFGSVNQSGMKIAAINLGSAANFAILSQSGITDVYPSAITGDVGTSPITGAALLLTCPEVTGNIYTVDAAGPLPCRLTDATLLTTAIGDMQLAYTNAASLINPNFLNLGAGNIGGLTLTKGLYKWTSNVLIASDITINGSSNDIFVFQVTGTLDISSGVNIVLTGGADAKNIFWVVAGAVTLGTTSHFEGTILAATNIAMQTGATINGRLLAQTAVTLQMNTVVIPALSSSPIPHAPKLKKVKLEHLDNFVILSQAGITNVYPSAITGDVGASPATSADIQLTCDEVTGQIFSVDSGGHHTCWHTDAHKLTEAVNSMQDAYSDAAGRINLDFLNLGSGFIGGQTLTEGLYKWTSNLLISSNITIYGKKDDVFIFQVDGTLDMGAGVNIILTGGVDAKNIFWVVAGAVTLGTTSHFEGTILGMTNINMQTGASINGRMFAQNAVNLQMNTVVRPH